LLFCITCISKTYYELLGLTKGASTGEIKRKFRKLALKLHPDKVDCSNEQKQACQERAAESFAEVRHAYEVLTNPQKRNNYDKYGSEDTPKRHFTFHDWFRSHHRRLSRQQKFCMSRVIEVDDLEHFRTLTLLEYPIGEPRDCFIPTGYDILVEEMTLDEAKLKCTENEACKGITYPKFNIDPDGNFKIWLKSKDKCIYSEETSFTTWFRLEGNMVAEKSLLIAFYDDSCEDILTYDIKFPWPFSGWSNYRRADGVWWENILLTLKHDSLDSDLAQFFGVTHCPTFVFIRQYDPISKFTKKEARRNHDFDRWMWAQLKVKMKVVNRHPNPINIYWSHDQRIKMVKENLQPGEDFSEISSLSHEYHARDATFESKVYTPPSFMATYLITRMDDTQTWPVRGKCFDFRGECVRWARLGECDNNAGYMRNYCRVSCGTCEKYDSIVPSTQKDEL